MTPEFYIFDGPSDGDVIKLNENNHYDFDLIFANEGSSGRGIRFTIFGEAIQKGIINIDCKFYLGSDAFTLEKTYDKDGNTIFIFESKNYEILDGFDKMELASQWMINLKFRIFAVSKGNSDFFFAFQPLINKILGGEVVKIKIVIE